MKTIIFILGVVLALLIVGTAMYLSFESTLVDHAVPLAVLAVISIILIGYGTSSK